MRENTVGSQNTAVGYNAMQNNTSGFWNTAVGTSALNSNTTGTVNTAVGKGAMLNNTIGGSNTAVGASAMNANTIGSNNTAVGVEAMSSNTSGANNTAVGQTAMLFNTTGANNTAVGKDAMRQNTTGAANTAVGQGALYANTSGADNTAVGMSAMLANTTGANNTAVGKSAMAANTTGYNNTAVGFAAMQSNTTGYSNTAVGLQAMLNNTTGINNTAVGASAMQNNTIGAGNTAVGLNAMYNNTTGNNNTAVGTSAMSSNTTGAGNTAVGVNALQLNTTGVNNTAVGIGAIGSNTIGIQNTAMGYYAMGSNTTGVNNTAVGYNAMNVNTIGINNTALGQNAMQNNTVANNNTAIGMRAMLNNTTGAQNTAVGSQSMATNTTGTNNTAVGTTAMFNNTIGGNNTAVGRDAMYQNSTGADNTAVGKDAMYNNTIGASNTAIGTAAMNVNTTGANNTAVGKDAMFSNTTGIQNTAVGRNAMLTNTTGINNTAIGHGAGPSTAGLTNTTCIGYNASASASNSVILGSGANVGIGTASPVAPLSSYTTRAGYPDASGTGSSNVVARIQSGSICLDFGSIGGTNPFWIQNHLSTNNATNYPILLNPNGGFVGVGTTNPSYTLDCWTGTVQANQVRSPGGNYLTLVNGAGGSQIVLQGTTTAITGGVVYMTGGNVGIGTNNASKTLTIVGTAGSTPVVLIRPDNTANFPGASLQIMNSGTGDGSPSSVSIGCDGTFLAGTPYVEATAANTPLQFRTAGTTRMTVAAGGNVGIGTTSPGAQLTVQNGQNTSLAVNIVQYNNYAGSGFAYIQDPGNANFSGGWNGGIACFLIGRATSTSRSINAAGTLNANGADYAEYMTKSGDFTIKKGDVVGVNAHGLLTNVFTESVTFVVKSTDPCIVGGDTWGTEEALGVTKPKEVTEEEPGYAEYQTALSQFNDKLEEARALVDRIAFAGQVPVNVLGATPGQYIVPVANEDGSISGQSVSNPTFEQYMAALGKVIKVLQDGRAQIIVKVV
jgi:hypothetical protein